MKESINKKNHTLAECLRFLLHMRGQMEGGNATDNPIFVKPGKLIHPSNSLLEYESRKLNERERTNGRKPR